jgi:hypothetical protein
MIRKGTRVALAIHRGIDNAEIKMRGTVIDYHSPWWSARKCDRFLVVDFGDHQSNLRRDQVVRADRVHLEGI